MCARRGVRGRRGYGANTRHRSKQNMQIFSGLPTPMVKQVASAGGRLAWPRLDSDGHLLLLRAFAWVTGSGRASCLCLARRRRRRRGDKDPRHRTVAAMVGARLIRSGVVAR